MKIAKFVKEISVIDPDTNGRVELAIYKHQNGGIFAVDSSFLDQCHDTDSYPVLPDIFDTDYIDKDVMLVG